MPSAISLQRAMSCQVRLRSVWVLRGGGRGSHRWRIVFNCGCQNTHRDWRTPITSKTDTHSEPPAPTAPISVSRKENIFSFYGTSVWKQRRGNAYSVWLIHITPLALCRFLNIISTCNPHQALLPIGQGLSYPRSLPLKSAPAPLWRVLTAKLPQTTGPSRPHTYRRSQLASDCRSQRTSDHRSQPASNRRSRRRQTAVASETQAARSQRASDRRCQRTSDRPRRFLQSEDFT